MTQKWMGHARMTTTAIYTDVSGPEEIALAEKFWNREKDRNPPLKTAGLTGCVYTPGSSPAGIPFHWG